MLYISRQYKIKRLRLRADAQVWMDAPIVETLIRIQWDQWKRKLLKKAANSDIAFWLVHNKTWRKLVQRGRFPNIVTALTPPEDLAAAYTKLIMKIAKANSWGFRMDGGTTDRWIRPSKWRTARLNKQRLVEVSTRNITEHLHQGAMFQEISPYPLLSGSINKGTVYIFMMNMIRVVNI